MKVVMDNEGLSLSRRRITLSTSGIVPEIAKTAEEIGCLLAVSFHATTDAVRDKLVTLKLQREDLLSRYKNDARPVQELDAQIAQLEAGIAAGRTQADGGSLPWPCGAAAWHERTLEFIAADDRLTLG